VSVAERLAAHPAVRSDPERLLRPAEAAAFLNMHPATLRKLKAEGRITYVAIGRGGYRRADLIAFRDGRLRRRGMPAADAQPEPPRAPSAPTGLVGWNDVTGRPFGMTAAEWAALGIGREDWEARQAPAEARGGDRRGRRKGNGERTRAASGRRSMQSPRGTNGRAAASTRPSEAGARPSSGHTKTPTCD
jgi:hypothetical protein